MKPPELPLDDPHFQRFCRAVAKAIRQLEAQNGRSSGGPGASETSDTSEAGNVAESTSAREAM